MYVLILKKPQTIDQRKPKTQHPKYYEQNLAYFNIFLPPVVSNACWIAQCLLTCILPSVICRDVNLSVYQTSSL